MTQRERYLAIAVGVVFGLFGVTAASRKIQNNISEAENRVDKAQRDLVALDSVIDGGQRAAIKIERLEKKSLPNDKELASAQYKSWLIELSNEVGLTGSSATYNRSQGVIPQVSNGNNRNKVTQAFQWHEFTLTGRCRYEKVVDLLAKYYDRDYLHRISKLSITRDPKQPNIVDVTLVSQAASLAKAKADQEPSLESSGRLAMNVDEYKKKILERYPFAPGNNSPKFEIGRTHEITIDKPWSLQLQASDPEGDRVKYEIVTEPGKLPEGLTLNRGELNWKPKEKGEKEILVRATDDGWPRKSTDLKIALKAVDAPVVKVEEPPNKLDPAKQAFVTALVKDRFGKSEGWIYSKAEGLSIDITEGTELNIGSIKAKVLAINNAQSFIVLETGGDTWTVDMDTSLADAWAKSRID